MFLFQFRWTCPEFLSSFVSGGAVLRVDPDSTGLVPAWRKSVGLIVAGPVWAEGTPSAEIDSMIKFFLYQLNEYLEPVSPDSGTYLNEVWPC